MKRQPLFRQLITGLALLACLSLQAQDTLKYKKVLVIPFNPELYLSDAEQDIMKHSRRTPEEYRQYFRNSLDLKIASELETEIGCVSLMQDTSLQAREDILRFYSICGYEYREPSGVKKPKDAARKNVKSSPDVFNQHAAPKYISSHGEIKYMNASVADTAWLKNFATRYNADLILSVNQFEIKTNYNSCLDIANKIYRRELMVHYSLLEPSGKLIQGNLAVAYFPSNSNRESDIASGTFPEIALFLKKQILGN